MRFIVENAGGTMTKQTLATMALGLGAAGYLAVRRSRRARRLDLRGRVVVVTGGGRGLGFAVARAFAARGCKLAICGRDGDVIARAVEELGRYGVDVFGDTCDVSEPAQVEMFIEQVLTHYCAIDVLINNAGQCFVGPAVELRAAELDEAFRNIFWVHYHPTMQVLPHMRQRGTGRIVNISSIGGKLPLPHQAAYVAAKYATTGWTQALSTELAKENIYVSTVTPPPLRNGAPLHVHFGGRKEDEFRWFTRVLTSSWMATSARRTARVIVDAAEHGDFERSVSVACWFATRAHGLAPNLMGRALAWMERGLPEAASPGHASEMELGQSVLARTHDEELQRLGARARVHAQRYSVS